MTHLDAETLERALHAELDPARARTARDHLAACRACAARLEAAGREEERLFALFAELDHEPPATALSAILTAARPLRSLEARPPRSWRGPIAAGLAFLVIAGGLAYALPGSPFRAWVRGVIGGGGSEAGPGTEVSGIAVRPEGPFEIVFTDPQSAGRIRVAVAESELLELRAEGAPLAIASEPDRLVVSNVGSRSSYEVVVPRSADRVRITVAGRLVFAKEGTDIRTDAAPDAEGRYAIDLTD